MQEKKAYQRAVEEQQVKDWISEFDADGNGLIDRQEFAKLIEGVYGAEGGKVDETAIDKLYAKCQLDTDEATQIKGVPEDKLRETVVRYREAIVHQEYLNALMAKFDKDKSGTLDRQEIKDMLSIILRDGASLTMNSAGREFKVTKLEEAYKKGLLDKHVYMKKLALVQGGSDVKDIDVTDDDVDFVMKEADADGNGELDREELLASMALWTKLLKTPDQEDPKASGLCSVM